jgi:glycosyltransferase involved in cell wall biosynthesis
MYIAAHNGARIWGGAERATALLLAGLQARGHRVRLYCNDDLVAERAGSLGVPVQRLSLGGDVAVPDALRFGSVLRRERPDVLLVGTYKKLWLASLAARLARVPRVVARVGLETDTPRSWKYRFVLERWVDLVVVNASAMRGAFLALPGMDEDRVAVIPNGVQPRPRQAEPGTVRASLGIPPGSLVVGSVARLAAQKRLDRLLQAIARVPQPVHCLLAGEGELRTDLESLARELGIRDRVHFLGHRDDVRDVLEALDLYVVSSDREGMSNAMLEALAAGLPVVSTPVSGAEEALAPLPNGHQPGVVLPDYGVDELIDTIGTLLLDPTRRAEMGAAGRCRVAEKFDFSLILSRWEAVLGGQGGDRTVPPLFSRKKPKGSDKFLPEREI